MMLNKLFAVLFGSLAIGAAVANAEKDDASIQSDREAKVQAMESVTESSPLSFSQAKTQSENKLNWGHRSHYSHRSSY